MPEPDRFDDEDVSALWATPFGAALFNLYTRGRITAPPLFFSDRMSVVRQMIRAMLDAEAEVSRRRPKEPV